MQVPWQIDITNYIEIEAREGFRPNFVAFDEAKFLFDIAQMDIDVPVNGQTMLLAVLDAQIIREQTEQVQAVYQQKNLNKENAFPYHAEMFMSFAMKDMVKLLLAAGADANAKNKKDETVIEKAIQYDSFIIFDMLLEHGADPLLMNDYGKMAIDFFMAEIQRLERESHDEDLLRHKVNEYEKRIAEIKTKALDKAAGVSGKIDDEPNIL